MMEQKFHKIMESDVVLAEESILVEKYMRELEEDGMGAGAVGGAPTNSTGAAVSTDIPNIKKKNIKDYQKGNVATGPVAGLARRATPLA
jgi:hypothetical protein